jgi:diaminohydroxyphosphoribosylaminopyrimidine deaminase/5-amino-6-(5-phosphoribosylamino)uracil reductase
VIDPGQMARAIELARPHHPHPNPRVGAVVVDAGGSVVGEGAHTGPGRAHAETIALEEAGAAARGGTVYVTLEPCIHHGRTPPCLDAVLAAGVATVVVANTDPDPRVSGAGLVRLREEGVEVVEGVMPEEAAAIDPAYFHHRVTGLPLVTIKYAMTLDGSVAAADATSRWITSESARNDAHRLRAEMDGVIVGAGTLRSDDPALSVRLDGFDGPQPRPVIVAGSGRLPGRARLWGRDPIVIATSETAIPSGSLVVVGGERGMPDPVAAVRALGDLGLLALLLEGGPTLAAAWWRAGVVTKGVAYLGALVGGGTGRSPLGGVFSTMNEAQVVSVTGVRSLNGDIRVDFERG